MDKQQAAIAVKGALQDAGKWPDSINNVPMVQVERGDGVLEALEKLGITSDTIDEHGFAFMQNGGNNGLFSLSEIEKAANGMEPPRSGRAV